MSFPLYFENVLAVFAESNVGNWVASVHLDVAFLSLIQMTFSVECLIKFVTFQLEFLDNLRIFS